MSAWSKLLRTLASTPSPLMSNLPDIVIGAAHREQALTEDTKRAAKAFYRKPTKGRRVTAAAHRSAATEKAVRVILDTPQTDSAAARKARGRRRLTRPTR